MTRAALAACALLIGAATVAAESMTGDTAPATTGAPPVLLATQDWRTQLPTMASANALERWVAAVRRHQPGVPDEAARFAAGLSYRDRVQLFPAMQVFLDALRGNKVPQRETWQVKIASLYEDVRSAPGSAQFLRRAAILHADAAVFADRFPKPIDDAPSVPAGPPPPTDPPPALVAHGSFVLHRDGQVIGETRANWNWPFARALLDLFTPEAERADRKAFCKTPECRRAEVRDPHLATTADLAFVSEWYHAVAAYFFARADLGDLRSHLQHAQFLPDDARILFDRACLAETLGLSYNQALHDDAGFRNAKARLGLELPSESDTNAEAERLFRRAIELDGAYGEARIRLARVLDRRGRHDEAMTELIRAQPLTVSPIVTFYREMVSGRVAQAQGRFDESLAHFRTAARLFPRAQSALVGASQAAVMASDVPGALAFVQQLDPRSGELENDPWRIYQIGAGRDANELLAALWTSLSKQ